VREVLFRESGEMKILKKTNGISWSDLRRKKQNGGKIGVQGVGNLCGG